MTILVIDNYDSFTFNLVHYLAELGAETIVVRNDALTTQDAMGMNPEAILLSPGPCTPTEAGICLALITAAAETRTPLFGVCLGHQALGQAFGGIVERAPQVMHGKVSPITHDGTGVFADISSPFEAARYHSLTVREAGLPADLVVNAHSPDGLIMGMRHRELPLHGVQFHPESIATQHGHRLLANFMALAGLKPDLSVLA
ncbi:aminodeoxychorismate/anthranilate synthase component II [Sandarakinorhabdus sp.]|uniref:anthranilate synthase component II n=1 Tax=Sandarakinorhabdus sp. TaxID=1916663 RepID=UPI00286DDC19|nr:aminodeoxychorismate/anthranilate synthase component II [Sandarakinorhabdus sp.]